MVRRGFLIEEGSLTVARTVAVTVAVVVMVVLILTTVVFRPLVPLVMVVLPALMRRGSPPRRQMVAARRFILTMGWLCDEGALVLL